jgi:hypothetical protein
MMIPFDKNMFGQISSNMFKSLGGMSSPKVKEFLMQETAQLNKA